MTGWLPSYKPRPLGDLWETRRLQDRFVRTQDPSGDDGKGTAPQAETDPSST